MILFSAVSEGEIDIHLYACKGMIPYFFATVHWNYPRDSTVNMRTDVSLLFFSNFKEINWSLTELYMNVFTDNNKLISINKSFALSHIIDCSTRIIWLQFCTQYVWNSQIKDLKAGSKIPLMYFGDVYVKLEDVIREGKQFAAKCYVQNQLSWSENRCTNWKNKTVDHSVQEVWITFSIDTRYGQFPRFYLSSEPPAFGKTFSAISTQWIIV